MIKDVMMFNALTTYHEGDLVQCGLEVRMLYEGRFVTLPDSISNADEALAYCKALTSFNR